MARYSLSLPTDFEVPALASVGGLLVAIALTKGGHALWAIGERPSSTECISRFSVRNAARIPPLPLG